MKIKYLLLFFLSASLTFAQNISLEEAVNIALKNNNIIKQYEEKLAQKQYEEKSSWGNFLPNIDLSVSYTHLNEEMSINLNPIREAMIQMQSANQVELANISSILQTNTPLSDQQRLQLNDQYTAGLNNRLPQFVETLKEQNFPTATVTGIQPLFMGGKLLAAKKYASSEEKFSKIELEKTKNEIIGETIKSYNRVLLLQSLLNTRRDVLEGIKQHKQNAEKLYQQGVIAQYHLLRAQVALAEARRNLEATMDDLQISQLALKKTLGIENDKEIILTDKLKYTALIESRDVLQEKTIYQQPVLRMIDEKKVAAEQNYNIARSAFLPQVAAFGKYELYPKYLSALEPRWVVGVQAHINIFSGFKDYLNLQKAEHLENEVVQIEMDAQKKVNLWFNKSYADLNKQQKLYETLASDIALNEENLRLNEKRFNSGLGTSIEVIDAQLSLEKAKIEREFALFNYYSAMTDLYIAVGEPMTIINIWNNQEKQNEIN